MSTDVGQERLVATASVLLPRVNLLPPEIAERVKFRRIQLGLGAGVLAAVGVVGLAYLGASSSVSDARTRLDAATAAQSVLQNQTAKYRDVTAVYSQAVASQAQLTDAMGDEVRYSQLLNDLSLTVPSNVWLKTLAFAPSAAPVAVPGAAAAPVVVAGAPVPVGTLTVGGVGFSHDDVAVWLESIAGLKDYADPYFSTSTEALIGTRKSVSFSSTATLLSTAHSNRYSKAGG